MIQRRKTVFLLIVCQILSFLGTRAADTPVFDLEELPVTGDLLNTSPDRLPASLSILGSGMLELADNRHFADVTGYFPNLNWAGGTSRPRYFQIRGIGENSQFGNEIPVSSVGFIIDGIDFTGIGTVASLFDIAKIEVMRGPQAAAFGANAMAGMILIETVPAAASAASHVEGSLGTNGLLAAGFGGGGSALSNKLDYRVSFSHHQDDGFRDNSYLNRDDTNARDEWSSQVKLNWEPSNSFTVKLNLMHFDFDNGYDAWALDNDSFNTSTDEPGQDLQSTLAAGLSVAWHASDLFELNYSLSITDSEMLYSYDWDWSNPDELKSLYGEEVYWGTDITDRARDVWSHDVRVFSTETEKSGFKWVAGAYHRDFQEEQAYFGIDSDYDTTTTALYGQVQINLADSLSLTLAGRFEDYSIDFSSANPWTETLDTLGDNEGLWGGKLALEYATGNRTLVYISVDRGYKAGGVNLDDEVPEDFRVYGSEHLLNYEIGWKGFLLAGRLWLNASLFLMDRKDIQVDSSVQLGDGNTFALYKDNAASGSNRGLELEVNWQVNDALRIFASIGLLDTEFDDYRYVDPADPGSTIDLGGRKQAYAPSYTYSAGIHYASSTGWFTGLAMEGKDAYLFDVVADQSLDAYTLVRMHVGYTLENWTCTLWVKNALDEHYDVRGFYFANEPPYYDTPRKWVSQGDPRQVGLTLRKRF